MGNLRSKNYLIVLLSFTTAAGGVFAWSQYNELSRLRTDGLQGENARADLQKRLWALEKRKNELDAEIANLRSRRDGNARTDPDGDPDAADQPGRARPGPGGFNRRGGLNNLSTLLDNPEFSKLWNSQQRLALDSRYAALFKNLNLSAADLDKFKNLLVEKQSAVTDVLSAAREQGLNPRDPADRTQIATLLQNAQAQVDSNIQQTLGAAQYAQYQNYEQTLPQRNVVNQLSQSLSYTSAPLQDGQSQQLVDILAATSPARNQGNDGVGGLFGAFGGTMGAPGTRSSPITDAAIAQAQSILTAVQMTALQQLQAQQQAQRQIAQMMRQTAAGGAAAGSGTTAPAQGGATAVPPPSTASKPPGG